MTIEVRPGTSCLDLFCHSFDLVCKNKTLFLPQVDPTHPAPQDQRKWPVHLVIKVQPNKSVVFEKRWHKWQILPKCLFLLYLSLPLFELLVATLKILLS